MTSRQRWKASFQDRRQGSQSAAFALYLPRRCSEKALIAIENVRLFQELEARTSELVQSIGELKALGEVGQAVSSTLDLQTVLSTIVGNAVQLSRTRSGVIYEY